MREKFLHLQALLIVPKLKLQTKPVLGLVKNLAWNSRYLFSLVPDHEFDGFNHRHVLADRHGYPATADVDASYSHSPVISPACDLDAQRYRKSDARGPISKVPDTLVLLHE